MKAYMPLGMLPPLSRYGCRVSSSGFAHSDCITKPLITPLSRVCLLLETQDITPYIFVQVDGILEVSVMVEVIGKRHGLHSCASIHDSQQ